MWNANSNLVLLTSWSMHITVLHFIFCNRNCLGIFNFIMYLAFLTEISTKIITYLAHPGLTEWVILSWLPVPRGTSPQSLPDYRFKFITWCLTHPKKRNVKVIKHFFCHSYRWVLIYLWSFNIKSLHVKSWWEAG